MIYPESTIGRDIRRYCAEIGADPLLVQGAGGNVSWKEDSTLWVKASGKCLAKAEVEDIFVPVSLTSLKYYIANHSFSMTPDVLGDSKLRPSIETILHALMPQRIVLHLHAVDILAHLVRPDFSDSFSYRFKNIISYAVVDYHKPGAELASAVDYALEINPSPDVLFLSNHGIVIGGDDITTVNKKLSLVTELLIMEPICKKPYPYAIPKPQKVVSCQYTPIDDHGVQQLAINPLFYRHLRSNWALYPDHVVFLGPKAHLYQSWSTFKSETSRTGFFPELVFLRGEGVFVKPTFTKAKKEQLRCYFDVLDRQKSDRLLASLTNNQICELLDWEAEKYRISNAI